MTAAPRGMRATRRANTPGPGSLKGELVYRDPGADVYDAPQRTRVLRRLRRRAATLGFELVSRATGELLDGVVSWETAGP